MGVTILITISAILFISLLILFIFTTISYIEWRSGLAETAPKITYNAFKKFYELYPDKWSLRSSYLSYQHNEDCIDRIIEFKSFYDVTRYQIFMKRMEREKINEKNNKNTYLFLKELQGDIDEYRNTKIDM